MFRVLRQPADGRLQRGAGRHPAYRCARPVRARQQPWRAEPRVGERAVRRPRPARPGAIFVPAAPVRQPVRQPGRLHGDSQPPANADRERLLHGDWEIPDDGELFQRDLVSLIEPRPTPRPVPAVRYWDLAGTEPSPPTPTPTTRSDSGSTSTRTAPTTSPTSFANAKPPGAIEQLVAVTAERDGQAVKIPIEQEPGSRRLRPRERYKRQSSPATRSRPCARPARKRSAHPGRRRRRERPDQARRRPARERVPRRNHRLPPRSPRRLRRRPRRRLRGALPPAPIPDGVAVPRGRIDFSRTIEYQYGYGDYQHSPYPYAPSTLPPREPVRHLNGAGYPDHLGRSQTKTPAEQGFLGVELAGLEPATSWVRSRRSPN